MKSLLKSYNEAMKADLSHNPLKKKQRKQANKARRAADKAAAAAAKVTTKAEHRLKAAARFRAKRNRKAKKAE